MFELIYSSSADKGLKQADIDAILSEAVRFNKEHGLTGCLLYYNQEFLQILEGDEDKVEDLFEKIAGDKRHYDVNLIHKGMKEDREFTHWHMAYYRISTADDLRNEEFVRNFKGFSRMIKPESEATKIFWYMANVILSAKD